MTAPFPTADDFKRISPAFPYDRLILHPDDIYQYFSGNHLFTPIIRSGDILTWVNSFNGRVRHASRSYVFMAFYIEKGIPENIELSHLTNEQHNIKDYFDYFADIFFYKLFSAWDTIGHIINLVFQLNIDRPSFNNALNKLKGSNTSIYSLYEPIITNPIYKEAKQIRHDITHNIPTGIIDQRPVQTTPTTIFFGVSKQIPASRVFNTANTIIPLLERTVTTLKQHPTP